MIVQKLLTVNKGQFPMEHRQRMSRCVPDLQGDGQTFRGKFPCPED